MRDPVAVLEVGPGDGVVPGHVDCWIEFGEVTVDEEGSRWEGVVEEVERWVGAGDVQAG